MTEAETEVQVEDTKEIVELTREDALALVLSCGFDTAPGWNNERLANKLQDVPEVYDGEPSDEAVAKTLMIVLGGVEKNCKFKILSDDPSDTQTSDHPSGSPSNPVKRGKPGRPARTAEQKAEAQAAKDIVNNQRMARRGEKAAKRESEQQIRNKQKKERAGKNKMFYAGCVVKQYGLQGNEEEMIKALNTEYGRPNDATSQNSVRNAIGAIRGFFNISDPNADLPA